MSSQRPPDPESIRRNAPSVEAAFQAAPEWMVAEILEGELHLSPRPARPHAHVYVNLASLLAGPLKLGQGGPGGWIILAEPELHLGPRPDKLVPDLAGWRRERLSDAADGSNVPAHYDLAADWICEILSPSTRRVDQGAKMRIYAREGVRHLWHVEPLARKIDIFRLIEGEWHLARSLSGEAPVRAEPFEAIELELGLVWSR